jgi:hypothetical protein
MLRLLVLTSLLGATLITGPVNAAGTAEDTARQLYGSNNLQLTVISEAALAAAFPIFTFYYVVDGDGLPGKTHIMAWDSVQTSGFDATKGFNSVLAFSGVVMTSSADAIRFAKAYAIVANAEVELVRQVVGSADSGRLGRTVTDPIATAVVGGWDVTLSTWAYQNGVFANWTISFRTSRATQVIWRIQDIGVGPNGVFLRAASLHSGIRITNTYSATNHTWEAHDESITPAARVYLPHEIEPFALAPITDAVATNFDDSKWQVYYPQVMLPTISPKDKDFAIRLAEGARDAYNVAVLRNPILGGTCRAGAARDNPNTNWGFESKDPNCELRIDLAYVYSIKSIINPAFTDPVYWPETRISIHALAKEILIALGYMTNATVFTVPVFSKLVAGHEFFHSLQFDIGLCTTEPRTTSCLDPLISVIEGTARFSETLLSAAASQDPTALWWGTPDAEDAQMGVNYYQRHPHLALCARGQQPGTPNYPYPARFYDAGLYWGFLYSRNGGIATIRDIITRIVAKHADPNVGPFSRSNCDRLVRDSINEALAQAGGLDTSHANALEEFGIKMWERAFSWAAPSGTTYNWGTHLLTSPFDVPVIGQMQTVGVGASGVRFTQIPLGGTYKVTYNVTGLDTAGSWKMRIAFQDSGGVRRDQFINLTPGASQIVSTTGWVSVFVEAVRVDPTDGNYTLKVEQFVI